MERAHPTKSPAPSTPPQANRRDTCLLILALLVVGTGIPHAHADDPPTGATPEVRLAERVDVRPDSGDQAIDQRLTGILESTGWYSAIAVDVRHGVVFLDGQATTEERRAWAGTLAAKTADVVAVVNRIEILEPAGWDLAPAWREFQRLWSQGVQRLPRLLLGAGVLALALLAAWLAAGTTRRALDGRLKPLLRDVAARLLSILVFLIGFYLVLQLAGLSGLAATILGGTGLAGLVAGFALRDILENYLASILISTRNPFRIGDLVDIAGHTGIVLRVTTRGTVLMSQDGNHVQIPNATVYKSIILNYTANPNRREVFEVGIGFDNELRATQELALAVLNRHPAVLETPEALVLVDQLGAATVNLKLYFWYDGTVYNGFKLRSALIRQVKNAFETHGISMPDENREILFPEGVPVRMLDQTPAPTAAPTVADTQPVADDTTGSEAEGGLVSEDEQLRAQARKARLPEEGADLL
ncbi:mechanosensitive ion channel family protein [Denitromonas halophila]|uniref:Small-conductance mechanosensitive channel n=1 Tax=Denitromonas halophila TaxID=1629404 RepID=A0A557R2D8_9RHOO|nr:mechanosensitive ion channel family protein [Denitromonas halophila]TVO59304.1 mechanosensitive ion channel [Denitromonas halophila]